LVKKQCFKHPCTSNEYQGDGSKSEPLETGTGEESRLNFQNFKEPVLGLAFYFLKKVDNQR
jgi:hypothetical protein